MSEQITIESVNGRRFPVGVERLEKGMHFRVWAPEKKTVKLVMSPKGEDLDPVHWSTEVELQAKETVIFRYICQMSA